jgi:hypothetical protein
MPSDAGNDEEESGQRSADESAVTSSSSIRVGTWNVLLPLDEYDPEYGCPLQIALCSSSTSSTSQVNDSSIQMTREECTLARQERVWQTLQDRAASLDVVAIQEVDSNFLQLLNRTNSSWTVIHQSGECALLLSTYSNYYAVASYTVELPRLSGCPSVPLTMFQMDNVDIDAGENAVNSSTLYIVGSIHVQASVTDMDEWYNVSEQLLYNASIAALTARTGDVASTQFALIVAGDFNHNLTDAKPRNDWQLVYATNNANLFYGTTQKEYNWMGVFDGFWVSPPFLYAGGVTDKISAGGVTRPNDNLLLQTVNVQAFVDGFMPKVMYHLPQLDGVEQTKAQFAILSRQNHSLVSRERILEWNDADEDLVLAFSESSDFENDPDVFIVPHANPYTQVLSDHMMVTAIFCMRDAWPNSIGDDGTPCRSAGKIPKARSSKPPLGSRLLSLLGVMLTAVILAVICRARKRMVGHPKYVGIPGRSPGMEA